MTKTQTLNPAEIAQFAKDSAYWWDENGPFAPLHRLNPTRIHYIRKQIIGHFERDDGVIKALTGLKILDVGCGGGLVCESLARLGAIVTGVDADAQAIQVAKNHAAAQDLNITYICGTAEDIAAQKKAYDVVLGLEVIEHVDQPAFFVETLTQLIKPDGLVIFSTLNRTLKSFALGVVAAEYILGWVPRGTHDWHKFITPAELGRMCRAHDQRIIDVMGLCFNPLKNEFALSKDDVSVNYFLSATRA
jgi:2-polyprenyl-6-hydroxyphenyl methylase / 3-demethylubiquinone-9 3-methyltransferase